MKDVIGEVWGRLTIIADAGKTERRIKLVKCRCSCSNHNEIIVQYNSLKRGLTKSCGCLRKIKYVNKRNGRLLVVAETYKSNNGPVAGLYCQCDCGNRYYMKTARYFKDVKSCGCLRSRKIKIVGEIHHRFTIIEEMNDGKVKCRCSCPEQTIVIVRYTDLKRGVTKSCGCLMQMNRDLAKLKSELEI